MSGTPDWLPPLVLFHDHGGDWEVYLEALYACFRQDFIDAKPVFQGRRLGLRRHPMSYGKEATFWHMIQEGKPKKNAFRIFGAANESAGRSRSLSMPATRRSGFGETSVVEEKGFACGLSRRVIWSCWRNEVSMFCF